MKQYISLLIFLHLIFFPFSVRANGSFNIEGYTFYSSINDCIVVQATDTCIFSLLTKDIQIDMRNDSPLIKYWSMFLLTDAGYEQRILDNSIAKNVKVKFVQEEIDKNNKKYRILKMIYLDHDMNVLRSSHGLSAWLDIMPNSSDEATYGAVCNYIHSYLKQ